MQKQQSLKGFRKPKQQFTKWKPRLIVDEYDSLNLFNNKQKQQLILCGFCRQQIPHRLMISHKKVCVQAEKNQYMEQKIPKRKSMQKLKKINSRDHQKQSIYESIKTQINKKSQKKKAQSQCKINRQSTKKIMKQTKILTNKKNVSSKANQLTQSLHFNKETNLKNKQTKSRQNSSKNPINKIIKEKKQENILKSTRKQPTNIKKISAPYRRNKRNFTQNPINITAQRQNQQQTQTRNQSSNRQRYQNTRNRNRTYNRVEMSVSEEQIDQQQPRRTQHNHQWSQNHHSTINFITHTLNEQFSMINSHFNVMNQVFSNFSSFIPNIYDQSSQYYFQNPIHTMFYQTVEQSDGNHSQDDSQEQNGGLDQQILDEIPRTRYPKTTKQQNCTICLSQVKEKEMVKALECAHLFHADCIDEWLRRKAVCPVCRQKI